MMMGFGFAIQGKLEADQQAGVGGKGRECLLRLHSRSCTLKG